MPTRTLANFTECTPAYGRDYKSQKEVRAAWDSGADFLIPIPGLGRSVPFNKADAERLHKGASFLLRYSKLEKVLVVKV